MHNEIIYESELQELQERYVLGTYAPHATMVRGNLCHLWDMQNRRYLDFTSGIAVCNLGHCHPNVTAAIQKQAAKLVHVSNLYFNENQPRLAALIAQNSFYGKVFFCNSGAEANEGMIKLARRWGHPQRRHEIIAMDHSFHGRTLATLAATGRSKYRDGFQPDMAGFVHVPFNDIDAVAAAINDRTAAILLEPIQGEGGVIAADRDYLFAVRELCNRHGILLLFDEVQSGMGRTGELFAYQNYGVEPDAMSMAKALANGFPLGAFEVRNEFAAALPPGTHASTFGGNPLACAAGIATFETFIDDKVLENCRRMSAYLKQRLQALVTNHACVKGVRGMGLMLGLELDRPAADLVVLARDRGLLCLTAGETILRLLPPLIIQETDADEAIDILDDALLSQG